MVRGSLVLCVLVSLVLHETSAYFLGRTLGRVFESAVRKNLTSSHRCPTTLSRIPSLNETCHSQSDCSGRTGYICCPLDNYRFCMKAVRPKSSQYDVPKHRPFLGLPRYCPTTDPLQEFLPVQNCTKDSDCEPRICCPDGSISYCRTAVFRLDTRRTPAATVIRNLVSYVQCSSPPPPSLDLFPKTCKYSFDCFPNICCQENGKKVCRPAKRSILRLFTSIT